MPPARILTLWCPDWPLVASLPSGHPPTQPAVVLDAGAVIAPNGPARRLAIHRGMKLREAQGCCPELLVMQRDENEEMRGFEAVLDSLEDVCPRVEVVRPGLCLFASKGPARYFGGDRQLADVVFGAVAPVLATYRPELPVATRIGIADGSFTSRIAAHDSPGSDRPSIIEPRSAAAFLASFSVQVLPFPELTQLFTSLGLHTLGDIAALPYKEVAARFGAQGAHVHRWACGEEEHLLRPRVPANTCAVHEELDPPELAVEPLTFVGKMLADRLADLLAQNGLRCMGLHIVVESAAGEIRSRYWRGDHEFSRSTVLQRVRWQLEGWLRGPRHQRPTAGISLLRLVPDELGPADGEQLTLLGGPTGADERAQASIERLQSMLGFDSVFAVRPGAGRSPDAATRLVEWESRHDSIPHAAAPWPGRLPAPHPTVLYREHIPVTVFDDRGSVLTVDQRGQISAVPQAFSIRPGHSSPIVSWAGPWRTEERWWDASHRESAARLQLVTADGVAHLVARRMGRWWLEGRYV